MQSADGIALTKWNKSGSASRGMMRDEETVARRLVLEHYDQEHRALRKYVSFLGIDVENSEDVVQESFLKLYEHLQRGGEQTNLRAWLYRVAHNLTRNRQTAWASRKANALADLAGPLEPVAQGLNAEQSLLKKERDSNLLEAMRELSPMQRECLVLRAQGLKYREMADVLELSVSTVAENVHRGLEKLRKLL